MRLVKHACFLLCLFTSAMASPQAFPTRPIQVIVPFSVGSTTDIMTRAIAQELSHRLGQPVVVDNRPGAGGNIGAEALTRAAPDGYTLMMGTNGPLAANPHLYDKVPFDPVTDFVPIVHVVATPQFLLASREAPVSSVADFVRLAKANPGKYNIGVTNTTARVWAELLKQMAGIDIVPVLYKDVGTMVGDLVSGRVQFAVENVGPTLSLVQGGKLRALALFYSKRAEFAPDVPTIAEAGYGKIELVGWCAVFAPKGTPRAIVDKLNREILAAMQAPDVRKVITSYGIITGGTPEQLGGQVKSELAQWADLVKSTGVSLK